MNVPEALTFPFLRSSAQVRIGLSLDEYWEQSVLRVHPSVCPPSLTGFKWIKRAAWGGGYRGPPPP